MAFCKTCGTQIPDGMSQCAGCAASSGAPAGQPAPAPFNPANAGNASGFAPGDAAGGFNPGTPTGGFVPGAAGGFDNPAASAGNGGNSKKGLVILGAAAVILIAVLIFLFNFFFCGYKKPIKNVVKGINKIDADKVLHAVIPKNQFNEFKEFIEDEYDEDYKDYIKDGEKDIKDEIKDNKIKYKVKVDFKGKKKVSNSTCKDIEEMASEFFEEMGLDEVEVKKAYRVKVKLEADLKYKKDSASVGTTFNIYVVKYKGCSGWYLAPYADADSLGGWADLYEDLTGMSLKTMMALSGYGAKEGYGGYDFDYDDYDYFDF